MKEHHRYKNNGLGLEVCEKCGKSLTVPDWPSFCNMTNTNTQPLSDNKSILNEVIINGKDNKPLSEELIEKELERLDGIIVTGAQSRGSGFDLQAIIDPVVWVETIRPEIKKSFSSLLSEAKREAVEECIKALPKKKEELARDPFATPWENGFNTGYDSGFNDCIDQSLKAMSELSSNQSK